MDLDHGHLECVSIFRFHRFEAKISHYQKNLGRYAQEFLQKKPIPGTHHSEITPLAINSADKMKNIASVWSGDRKTFNTFLLAKKLLAAESGDFDSLRRLVVEASSSVWV